MHDVTKKLIEIIRNPKPETLEIRQQIAKVMKDLAVSDSFQWVHAYKPNKYNKRVVFMTGNTAFDRSKIYGQTGVSLAEKKKEASRRITEAFKNEQVNPFQIEATATEKVVKRKGKEVIKKEYRILQVSEISGVGYAQPQKKYGVIKAPETPSAKYAQSKTEPEITQAAKTQRAKPEQLSLQFDDL